MTTGIQKLVTTTRVGQRLSIYSESGNFAFEARVVLQEETEGNMVKVTLAVVPTTPGRWAVPLRERMPNVGDEYSIYRYHGDEEGTWMNYWGYGLLVDSRLHVARQFNEVFAEIGSADWVNDLLGEE